MEYRNHLMRRMGSTHAAIQEARARAPAPSRRHTLAVEIIVALTLKVLFIYALWFLFFSHPLDEHLDGEGVAAALFDGMRDVQTHPLQRH